MVVLPSFVCVCSAGGCRLGIPPENTQINVDIQALLGAAGQHWPWWHFAEEKKVSGKAGFVSCLLAEKCCCLCSSWRSCRTSGARVVRGLVWSCVIVIRVCLSVVRDEKSAWLQQL